MQEKAKWDEVVQAFSDIPIYWMRFHGSTRHKPHSPLLALAGWLIFWVLHFVSVDKVLDAMDYAVYVHDVEHVILDNLQFMLR